MSSVLIKPARDSAIDVVRGIAMIVMALDHARDYFGDGANPTDLKTASFALFLTRWITHFCAPIFVFLAGTAASLYGRGKPKSALSRFLLTRGAWLVLLELTVVRFTWKFDPTYHRGTGLQVIWAIGWSMIALGLLVYLPRAAVVAIGALIVGFHNCLDGIHAASFGHEAWLWSVVHEPGSYEVFHGVKVFFVYPILPWIGVMSLGYGAGAWAVRSDRKSLFFRAGAIAIVAFIVLRASRIYGDKLPWTVEDSPLMTLASFLNCTKYPPSLLYVLMTLGPSLLLLALLSPREGEPTKSGRALEMIATFGRVPLFYYVLHVLLIHTVASLLIYPREGFAGFYAHNFMAEGGRGLSLLQIYGMWIGVVIVLYPACLWFARVKMRRHDWWLGYL